MHHLRTTLLDFAKASILLVVVGVGAATLSAQSNWTPPSQTPPAGNAAAPINVSNLSQWKRGPLFIGTTATLPYPLTTTFDVLGLASTTMLSTDNLLVSKAATFVATPVGSPMKLLTFTTQGLTIADGTQGAGKVLTSDASGLATWQTPAAACTTTDVPMGTYSIDLNSGNNSHTHQLLVGNLEAGTYKLRGNGAWSSVGGGGALGIFYSTTQTWTTPPGAPAGATAVGTPEIYLYNVGNFVNYVQHYGGDSGVWTAGNGSNENTFTLTQAQNLYASGGQSAMSGSVSLYRVVSSCGSGGSSAIAGFCDAAPVRTITQSNSGTEYQNTTGAQLMVVATASETTFSGQNALAGYIGASSASTLVSQEIFTSTNRNSITFLVPPGYYYKVVNGATNNPTLSAQAWKLCSGGSSGGSGATSSGISLSDIRSALTYTSTCSAGEARGITNASCTASCSAGKKVISGSCVAKTAAGTNPWTPYPINTSAPTADGSGWSCNGVSPAGNTAVMVVGNAVCL